MRIDRVTVNSFGAIKNRYLNLSPGLTVVIGNNGTGKSTWHAALYAALCGHQPTVTPFEGDFEELWAPEDVTEWSVSCELSFDDGRMVEVHQDLRNQGSTVNELRGEGPARHEDRTADMVRQIGLEGYLYAATAWIGHEVSRAHTGASDVLLQSVSRYVKHPEANHALRWLEKTRQRVDLFGPGGRRSRAEQEYNDLSSRSQRRKELSQRADDAARALEAARDEAAAARRQWRLGDAAVTRATVRQLEEGSSRTWLSSTAFGHSDMPSFGVPQNTDTIVHWTVVSALQELDEAEAALAAWESESAVEQAMDVSRSYLEYESTPWRLTVTSPFVVVFGALFPASDIAATSLPPVGWVAALSLATVGVVGAIVLYRLRRRPAEPDGSALELPAAKPEPLPQPDSGPVAELFPGLVTEPDPSTVLQRFPGLVPEPDPEPVPQLSPRLVPEPDPEPVPQRYPGVPAEPDPGMAAEPDLEQQARPEPQPDVAARAPDREAAIRRVSEASDRLLMSLTARGVRPGVDESVRQLLHRYSAECAERAEAEINEQARLAELHHQLEVAREKARIAAEGFEDYEIPDAGEVDVYTLHSQYDKASTRVVDLERAVASIASQLSEFDSSANLDEALSAAQDKLVRMQVLDESLRITHEHLFRACRDAYQPIAAGVQLRLYDHMVEIFRSKNVSAKVDPQDMSVKVAELRGRGRLNVHRSASTDKLATVFARISLGQHLGGQDQEWGPLLLDDIVSHTDDERTVRVLNRLLPMVDHRQVVIFAQQEAVASWAHQARQSKPDLKLIRLRGVDCDPAEGWDREDGPAH